MGSITVQTAADFPARRAGKSKNLDEQAAPAGLSLTDEVSPRY
jgi:hypothetical protein